MALKKLKPVTPSSRGVTLVDYRSIVTNKNPYKPLTIHLKSARGRSGGKITMHHKGGGVKKLYRVIDFSRRIRDVEGKIKTIEYDPNRSCFISLVSYSNGLKNYIITPQDVKVGDKIIAGENVPVEVGNAVPLSRIPVGTTVHNIEINPGSGGTLVRAAGTSAVVIGFSGDYAQIRMPSKEIRLINTKCYATIGAVSNPDYKNILKGSAGRNRRKGIRPTVRGMVKPPSAHPHGGGEAKGVIGHIPKDRWGNVRGKITRRKRHRYNHMRLVNRKGRKLLNS
ncbi:MAG: 50S ribosomal protein L2 [Candidatus Dojkabacteria bacterium]|nr:MAG: 50S ribosomal protein L2 [Candidatus Dojkabacteria bacterium]